ncbi:glycosyltransferase [Shewanella yunxiaonensis]|uniref:Glycosyltransferase n=1 Tax=Shewanella yunxiaonensis TaxID=2829809 RepID=A0ABX7YVU9_9GAMM|nr:glycosyltransferase [Shewanella yunxiaonensis]QUN06894.1 glycosyltransferase [Shewanella yunxiaonensis]
MIKVAVLLSFYNGHKYIDDQIFSILNQRLYGICVDIYIRNDGSTCIDSLCKLNDIKTKHPHIRVIHGENIGVVNSFLELLEVVDGYEYYAFCDQDDYWLPNKIGRAVEKASLDVPFLYCGKYTLVDAELEVLDSNIRVTNVIPSFQNALFKNFCTGCTCLINSKLRNEILKINMPTSIPMHDWYLLLVAYCKGRVFYDSESHILYRQHGSNVVGGVTNFKDKFKRYFRFIIEGNKTRSTLAEHLKSINTNQDISKFLDDLVSSEKNVVKRVKLIADKNWTYAAFLDRLSVYITVLFYRF